MWVFTTIFLYSLIGPFIHLYYSKKTRTREQIVDLFLLYQIVINVGILSLISALALFLKPDMVAKTLNWPTCPFQHELANVNLGFGTLGILSIWRRGGFWDATVIGACIWLFGDGIGHIINAYTTNNFAAGNVGVPLYTDILISVLLMGTWIYKQIIQLRPSCGAPTGARG